MNFKNVMSIAGSDPSGGAGIQADLKTFNALGVYGSAVITCLTVQNTQKVYDTICLEGRFVKEQIEAVLEDIDISFIKIGMLGDSEIVKSVSEILDDYFVVCDPVMISKSGFPLLEDKAVKSFKELIIPRTTVLTPNYHEMKRLTGGKTDDPEEAGNMIMEEYENLKAVLIKGGDFETDKDEVEDILIIRDSVGYKKYAFSHERFKTENTHGTGCTLSSAITAYLARNNDLVSSVEMAIDYVSSLLDLATTIKIGKGNGPLPHFAGIKL